jgi:multidrug resistance efflux pump
VGFNSERAAAAGPAPAPAVAEAKVKVREAEQAIAVHAKLVAVQEAVIKAKQAEVKAAETGLERLRRAGAVTQELQMREAQEKVDALRTGVEAEERKLDQLQAAKPTTKVDEANAAVKRFEVKVTQARVARDEYTLKAPVEGEIIRSMVEPGVAFTAQSRQPAFWFRPKAAKLIIRAEIDQEFANRVKAGLAAEAEDETDPTARWKAKVTRLGQAFLPRRTGPFGESLMSEPTRTLEAILQLQDIGENPPRIGQKVRVTIQ